MSYMEWRRERNLYSLYWSGILRIMLYEVRFPFGLFSTTVFFALGQFSDAEYFHHIPQILLPDFIKCLLNEVMEVMAIDLRVSFHQDAAVKDPFN